MTQQTEIRHDNIDFFRRLAESKDGKCLSETYTNSQTKLLYECKNGHRWYAYTSNTIKGHWCQRCAALEKAAKKKLTIELFKKIATDKGGKCLSDNYSNQNDRLLFECKNGHQWYGRAVNIKRGDWCRICSYEIIAQKQKEHRRISNKPLIDIATLQDIAISKDGRLISNEYKNATTKLLWECSEKHQWWTTAQNIRAGNWCKKCSSRKASEHLKKDINDCKELAVSNEGFCLSENYINSQTNLTWKCKNGHTWQATYANVKKGTWCKICSRNKAGLKRRTPLSFFQNYAIEKGGVCLSQSYTNQTDRLDFQCVKGHSWGTMASVIKNNKAWCPICAGTYKADTPELEAERLNEIKQIAQNHGGECLSDKYVNQKIKLQFKCKEGHIWWTVSSVIKNGNWCKRCSSKQANEWKRDNIEVFKKIIESKGGKCLTTEYESAGKSRLLVECDKGHQWLAFPQHIKKGLWCRKCNGSFKHELADVIKLGESRGGKCLSTEYKNDMSKIIWQCAENHIWEATPNNIKRGKWCPTCNSGIGERVCRLSFEKIFHTHFNKVRPNWLRNKSGFVLELDGYNEELKLAFEHQGTQHYSLKANHRFVKPNLEQNDKEKAEMCKAKGVTIIYIPEVFTDTKLNNLILFILTQLNKSNIPYLIEAQKIILNPREVYTYTKTKEVQIREDRATQLLQDNKASLLDIFRNNNGVKVKIKCSNNHTTTNSISQILNGTICKKCIDLR